MRKLFRQYHNRIIKWQAWTNGVLCILSACCLDSEGYTAQIICAATLLWLAVFAYANKYLDVVNAALQYENQTEDSDENAHTTNRFTGAGGIVSTYGSRGTKQV